MTKLLRLPRILRYLEAQEPDLTEIISTQGVIISRSGNWLGYSKEAISSEMKSSLN